MAKGRKKAVRLPGASLASAPRLSSMEKSQIARNNISILPRKIDSTVASEGDKQSNANSLSVQTVVHGSDVPYFSQLPRIPQVEVVVVATAKAPENNMAAGAAYSRKMEAKAKVHKQKPAVKLSNNTFRRQLRGRTIDPQGTAGNKSTLHGHRPPLGDFEIATPVQDVEQVELAVHNDSSTNIEADGIQSRLILLYPELAHAERLSDYEAVKDTFPGQELDRLTQIEKPSTPAPLHINSDYDSISPSSRNLEYVQVGLDVQDFGQPRFLYHTTTLKDAQVDNVTSSELSSPRLLERSGSMEESLLPTDKIDLLPPLQEPETTIVGLNAMDRSTTDVFGTTSTTVSTPQSILKSAVCSIEGGTEHQVEELSAEKHVRFAPAVTVVQQEYTTGQNDKLSQVSHLRRVEQLVPATMASENSPPELQVGSDPIYVDDVPTSQEWTDEAFLKSAVDESTTPVARPMLDLGNDYMLTRNRARQESEDLHDGARPNSRDTSFFRDESSSSDSSEDEHFHPDIQYYFKSIHVYQCLTIPENVRRHLEAWEREQNMDWKRESEIRDLVDVALIPIDAIYVIILEGFICEPNNGSVLFFARKDQHTNEYTLCVGFYYGYELASHTNFKSQKEWADGACIDYFAYLQKHETIHGEFDIMTARFRKLYNQCGKAVDAEFKQRKGMKLQYHMQQGRPNRVYRRKAIVLDQ